MKVMLIAIVIATTTTMSGLASDHQDNEKIIANRTMGCSAGVAASITHNGKVPLQEGMMEHIGRYCLNLVSGEQMKQRLDTQVAAYLKYRMSQKKAETL